MRQVSDAERWTDMRHLLNVPCGRMVGLAAIDNLSRDLRPQGEQEAYAWARQALLGQDQADSTGIPLELVA